MCSDNGKIICKYGNVVTTEKILTAYNKADNANTLIALKMKRQNP